MSCTSKSGHHFDWYFQSYSEITLSNWEIVNDKWIDKEVVPARRFLGWQVFHFEIDLHNFVITYRQVALWACTPGCCWGREYTAEEYKLLSSIQDLLIRTFGMDLIVIIMLLVFCREILALMNLYMSPKKGGDIYWRPSFPNPINVSCLEEMRDRFSAMFLQNTSRVLSLVRGSPNLQEQ